MEKIEISGKALGALASSAERFIGYFYAGILPLAILAIEKNSLVKECVGATGGVLAAIICLGLGIGIYTVYFRIIGELFIYPMQHGMHILLDWISRRTPQRYTSTILVLRGFGVPLYSCRTAYQAIKDELFTGQERSNIQISHGELHVIYLTAVITTTAYVLLRYSSGSASSLYLVVAGTCFFAGLLADTRQHSREAFRLRAMKNDAITFLKEHGFIRKEKANKANAADAKSIAAD